MLLGCRTGEEEGDEGEAVERGKWRRRALELRLVREEEKERLCDTFCEEEEEGQLTQEEVNREDGKGGTGERREEERKREREERR